MKIFFHILSFTIVSTFPLFTEENVQAQYDSFLKKYVTDLGDVDYKGMSKDYSALDAYLKFLSGSKTDKMNKNEKMALYINAYNAYTLKLILNHYPLKSIKNIPRSKRWKYRNWNVAGKKLSLEDIEHEILRPMGDARIHFAINCASKSCPNLLNRAYKAKELDAQLKKQTQLFFRDTFRGLAVKESSGFLGFSKSDRLFLSKLFDWFEKDFIEESGTLVKYINTHADEKVKKKIAKMKEGDIKFLDYDWSLNGK